MPTKGIQTGPVDGTLKVRVIAAVANIRVHTEPGLTAGRVEISTPHDSGPTVEAFDAAEMYTADGVLHVTVPGPPPVAISGDFASLTDSGRRGGQSIVIGSLVASNVHFGSGNMVNYGGGAFPTGNVNANSADPIAVTLWVPEGTNVHAEVTINGSIDTTDATLASVYARVTSGPIRVGTAADADLATQSGDVSAQTLQQPGRLDTKNGDIQVGIAPSVDATTMRGNINAANLTGPSSSQLTTMTGNIRVGGGAGVSVYAETMTGNIRFTNHMDVTASVMVGTVRGVAP